MRDRPNLSETAIGNHLYLVECKRRQPENPVEVRLIRELYGVVVAERATAGLLVTTSSFTRDALQFQAPIKHQLSLKSYADLVKWLEHHAS